MYFLCKLIDFALYNAMLFTYYILQRAIIVFQEFWAITEVRGDLVNRIHVASAVCTGPSPKL